MTITAQTPPAADPDTAWTPVPPAGQGKSRPIPVGTTPNVQDQGGVSMPGPAAVQEQRQTVNRLRRAHGQLGAVIAAVQSGADCTALVPQLSAVREALDKAGFSIISTAMRDCLTVAPAEDGTGRPGALSLEEIRKLFLILT